MVGGGGGGDGVGLNLFNDAELLAQRRFGCSILPSSFVLFCCHTKQCVLVKRSQ